MADGNNSELMNEIGAALADIAAALDGPGLSELGAALVDIAASLEKPRPIDAEILAVLKGMNLSPRIEVSPTPVIINQDPTPGRPAASDWTSLRVKVDRGPYGTGPMESFTITKVK